MTNLSLKSLDIRTSFFYVIVNAPGGRGQNFHIKQTHLYNNNNNNDSNNNNNHNTVFLKEPQNWFSMSLGRFNNVKKALSRHFISNVDVTLLT